MCHEKPQIVAQVPLAEQYRYNLLDMILQQHSKYKPHWK